MHSNKGSGAFTDFGVNLSTQITDKLRVGAQVYDRNLGNLGEWHPTLDWAFVDHRFKLWFGVRGEEVKTVIGLYNDTQDLDFLRTFALLPQSVYPTDLRTLRLPTAAVTFTGIFPSRTALGTSPIRYTRPPQRQPLQRIHPHIVCVRRQQAPLRRIAVRCEPALEYSSAWASNRGVASE